MTLQLTLSCDSDKIDNGPTLIHSNGVEGYKIPPDVIQILQENLTNDLLNDTEEGVVCQENPQRILDILRQNGFNLQDQTNDEQKTSWILVQNTGEQTDETNPTTTDENDANAEGGNEESGGGGGDGNGDEEQQTEE